MRLNLSKYEHCVKKLECFFQQQSSWGEGVLVYRQDKETVSNINFITMNKKQSTNRPAQNINTQEHLNRWIASFNLDHLVIIKDDLTC